MSTAERTIHWYIPEGEERRAGWYEHATFNESGRPVILAAEWWASSDANEPLCSVALLAGETTEAAVRRHQSTCGLCGKLDMGDGSAKQSPIQPLGCLPIDPRDPGWQ